jgi:hypothetical protein
MILTQPINAKILAYLTCRMRPGAAECAAHDAIPNPYYGAGCHPEIVERLWDQIGAALPKECRFLVYGTPALVHPECGTILGLGIGTAYGLYLPGDLGEEAAKVGCRTTTVWSGGSTMDIQSTLGGDWFFGAWKTQEPSWCCRAYQVISDENVKKAVAREED